MIEFQHLAAAVYLASGVGALVGMVLPSERMSRGAVWGLALGALLHGIVFATLHRVAIVPSLTDLGTAVSFMAWFAVLFLLLLLRKLRLPGLVAVAGPVAFLAVFLSSLGGSSGAAPSVSTAGAWPHAHVLLGSAGLAQLSVAGLAGVFFLIEHRRLKSKRPVAGLLMLPSLEALDRVNAVALAVGFPLLTLGLITGMFWLEVVLGSPWSGSSHETFSAIAWCIYAGLVTARFAGHQRARQAAASAVGGFVFLLFAIVGVELLA